MGEMSSASDQAERNPADDLPLVSIVVPVWNGERHLRESLDSILGQTYPRLEVIAVDDASTDTTPAILASYGDRISVIRQPKTRGIYGNANDGIAVARGEFVGVFHADDVYRPEIVEREVDWLLAHGDAGVVFTSAVFIRADGSEFGRKVIPPEVGGGRPLEYATVLNALLSHKNAFLVCPTALVRMDVYRRLGAYRDAEFKNTSDLEMWLRIARSYRIGVLDDLLIDYRRGQGSSSENYHRLRTEQERFFTIMDIELDANGGRAVATREALAAYEAHRAQDTLMRAVSHYVLGDREAATSVLQGARLTTLARSPRIQRARMISLATGLNVLVRLPRISAVARLFERRWHRRAVPARH